MVNFVRAVYRRFRDLIHEAARFGMVGLADRGGARDAGPLASGAVAIVAATALSYAGNRYWTFRHRQRAGIGRESVRYVTLYGAGLAIQLSCVSLPGMPSYQAALVTGTGLAAAFRFWCCRAWVWPGAGTPARSV